MLSIIKDKRVGDLEMLVVTGYVYITDLLNEEREAPRRLCERLREDRTMKEMSAFVQKIPIMQVLCTGLARLQVF